MPAALSPSDMLALLPIFILLVAAAVLLLIRLARPHFAFTWLIAAVAAVLVWVTTFLLRLRLPLEISLVSWQPQALFPFSPALLVDRLSWPYALALASLTLAVVLTDVARAAEADWSAWATSLALTGLGLWAVLSGNLLTLLLAWAAMDIIEIVTLLSKTPSSLERERVVISSLGRVAGVLVGMWGGIVAISTHQGLDFTDLSPQLSVYLFLAVGLRLGVLPLHQPFPEKQSLRRGLGTLLRLAPTAGSLALLTRLATAGSPAGVIPYLLALVALVALYASASWASASNELDGRQFWILGMAGLATAAALRAQPAASLSWGVALLLAGGLIFLYSARNRYLLLLPILGLVSISALPFTPTWEGVRLYVPPFSPLWLLLMAVQAFLMIGYLRHALRPGPGLPGAERWVWLIYPLGLGLLPLAHFITGWWGRPQGGTTVADFPSLLQSLMAVIVLAMAGAMIAAATLLERRRVRFPVQLQAMLQGLFSFGWIYQLLWSTYRSVGRLIGFVSLIMEGEGGILWALLLLTLLLSLLSRFRPGS